MIKTQLINITDEKYFKFHTQALSVNQDVVRDINVRSATAVPLFSAAKDYIAYIEPIEKHPPIYASEDSPLISFASNGDGSAGKNFVYHTTPFYINRDRIALSCRCPDISLKYVLYQIRDIKSIYGFNHHFKANKKNLICVQIEIPISKEGNYDLNKQEEIANKWDRYKGLINTIESQTNQIRKSFISPNIQFQQYKSIQLSDSAFDFILLKVGFNQSQYRAIDTKNENDIPMYTAQLKPVAYVKQLTNIQPIFASQTEPVISVADDGDGTAGKNLVYHTKPYYQNTSRISFRINNKKIVPEYVFYVLRSIKSTYGFNYQYKAKKENLELVSIEMPCNYDGEYDLEKQKQYINKCKILEDIQNQILNLSNVICKSSLSII